MSNQLNARPVERTATGTLDVLAPRGPLPDAFASGASADTTSRVLANTYRLLAMTLVFSASVTALTVSLKLPAPGILLTLAGYFGLLFLTTRLRNSAWGLPAVFALTGFMGYTLGPIIAHYLSLPNGSELVGTSLATTGVAFFALSSWARRSTAPNMLRLGTFLGIGVLVAFALGLAAVFLELPMLSLAVSGLFVLLSCALIMYQMQAIVSGGETNYIMATVSLFASIFNLFISLLQILGFISAEDA